MWHTHTHVHINHLFKKNINLKLEILTLSFCFFVFCFNICQGFMYIIKVEDRLVVKTRGSAGMGGDKKIKGT